VAALSLLLLAVFLVAAMELEAIGGRMASALFASAAISAFAFSLVRHITGGIMREHDDTIKAEGFGVRVDVPAKVLSREGILFAAFCLAFAWLFYQHHMDSQTQAARTLEAVIELTYVISLPQAERERLNLRMPESLRRKLTYAGINGAGP